jgi:menaquinone-dependent protoporphyrinogen oxidase
MRVLVTWGSKRGGTEGIARVIAETLEQEGLEVHAMPPKQARRVRGLGFDAVIVGGALYANRWHKDARRFVAKREHELLHVPVWFFSSGPLDDSADRTNIAPTKEVSILMERVGAQAHATFGGKLDKDARGFPASAMAKTHAGDFRDEARIREWARAVAHAIPEARPRPQLAQPGRSIATVVVHAVIGWAICAIAMAALLRAMAIGGAFAIHASVAAIVFGLVARHYFAYRGARDPFRVALAFAGITALLDATVVSGLVLHGGTLLTSFAGFWLPIGLIFVVTFVVGEVATVGSFAKPEPPLRERHA